jgi:hypothetical protein
MKPSFCQLTFVRTDALPPQPGKVWPRVQRITPLPVIAGAHNRADANLRLRAEDLTSGPLNARWKEVMVELGGRGAEAGTLPAVLLIDREFPISICLYGESATIVVDLEPETIPVAQRVRYVRDYVDAVRGSGYTTMWPDGSKAAVPVTNEAVGHELRTAMVSYKRRGWRTLTRPLMVASASLMVGVALFRRFRHVPRGA